MFGKKKNKEDDSNKKDNNKREERKLKFSKSVLEAYSTNTKLIDHEILQLNDIITNLITKYDNALSEVKDKRSVYKMDYADYRYMYEELINLILLKYQFQNMVSRKFFLNDPIAKNKYIDNVFSFERNCINIDFKMSFQYSSFNICQVVDTALMSDLTDKMNNCIGRICVYNNNHTNIEIEEYVKAKHERVILINDYNMLCNNQYYTTISKILTISNICKNKWFKMIADQYNKSKDLV